LHYTRIIIVVLGVTLFFHSCDKAHSGDCFTSTGDIVAETRMLDDFIYLSIYDNFNVYLITDTLNKIEIKAGKNLIPNITTEIVDDTLKIRNTNTCNWVRSYKKPFDLYITSNTMRRLFVWGHSNVETVNAFKARYFYVEAASPISSMKLDVDVSTFYFSAVYTTGDFFLTGITDSLRVFNYGTGYVFAKNLESRRCWVLNSSTGDCQISTSKRLYVEIYNSGNVYYSGNPGLIDTIDISSTGKLIKY